MSITIDLDKKLELAAMAEAAGISLSRCVNEIIVDFFTLRNARIAQYLKQEAYGRGKADDPRNASPKQILATIIQMIEQDMLGTKGVEKNGTRS